MIRSRSKHFMKHVRRKGTASVQYQNISCCGYIAGFLLATRRRAPLLYFVMSSHGKPLLSLVKRRCQPRELVTGLRSVTRMRSSYIAAILSEDPCIRATLFHTIVFISFIAQAISVAERDPIVSNFHQSHGSKGAYSCPAQSNVLTSM